MSLIKAMSTVAGLTGLSRIAGFVRDILTASILGAGPIADAFFVALKLPNFFRRVTAEGAFSVAFVPLYSESIEKEGQETADRFASNAFIFMTLILSVFTVLGIIFMPYIIMAIAPGFSGNYNICDVPPCEFIHDPRFDKAVEFSRITFSYLLLMSLTALLGGVLNAKDRFAPFAFAPVLFNLCLIVALLCADYFPNAGYALSYGILISGFLQLFFLMYCAYRTGFRLLLKRPKFSPKIKRVFVLMGPGVIGAGVMHINLFADLILASFLKGGAISYLYYADRLNQLPLGVVGIAVGTALLPMLSKAMSAERMDEARNLFNRALEFCLLMALPAAIALMVIPNVLVAGLFERGAFDSADTSMTSSVLMAYALGLPAYIATKVFSTMHWARQDTVTPVRIAVKATLANIILSIIFIQFIGVTGIALATGLTGWMQFYLHIRALKGHPVAVFDNKFRRNAAKIVVCSLVMASTLFLLDKFALNGFSALIEMIILVAVGLIIYAGGTFSSSVLSRSKLKKLLQK